MVDVVTRCPGCMAVSGGDSTCPSCGHGPDVERTPVALPERALLHERFYLGRLLGKPGGHGITYLAWDLQLETTAAIKEYLPQRLATRLPGATTVTPHTSDEGRFYADGMAEFLREARTLVRFSHPNIVRVRDFFEENGSAYLVMDYYEGQSLAEYLTAQPALLDAQQAVALMLPVLDGLGVIHRDGYLHRDIKPSNIYLADGERPILLDFGAARQALGEETESLSVVLTPGYAPFEQYFRKGRQGPWTDIYSCAATLYYMMSGIRPPPALDRHSDDELVPLAAINDAVPGRVSNVVMGALALDTEARPDSAARFARELADSIAGTSSPPRLATRERPATPPRVAVASAGSPRWLAALAAALAVAVIALLIMMFGLHSEQPNEAGVATQSPVSPAASSPAPSATPAVEQSSAAVRTEVAAPAAITGTQTATPAPEPDPDPDMLPPSATIPAPTSTEPAPAAVVAAPQTRPAAPDAAHPEQVAAPQAMPVPPAPPSFEPGPPSAGSAPTRVPRDAATGYPPPPYDHAGGVPPGPPPGATTACNGAASGEPCAFESPRGSVSGQCRRTPLGVLACMPAHHRGPPPPR